MNNHLLPHHIYKFIPTIYIGLGLYIWARLDTVYALVSGAMMVGAGIVAIFMRYQAANYIDETLDTWTGEMSGKNLNRISMRAPPVSGILVTEEIYIPSEQ